MDFNTEMSDLNQASSSRKYFLFVDGRPLGPLSRRFIIDQLMQENVGEDAYLWCEGMPDWRPLIEIKEFENLVRHLPTATRAEALAVKAMPLTAMPRDLFVSEEMIPLLETEANGSNLPISQSPVFGIWAAMAGGVALISLLVGIFFVLQKTIFISEPAIFATLEDQPARILQLRQNLKKPISERQWQWARIKSDPRAPQILLQTPWKEGTRFEIRLRGVPQTLIGALKANATVAAMSGEEGLAMIDSLRQRDGSFLPEGQYHLQVHCLTCGTAQEEVLSSALFVGDQNTGNYERRLREFHELLQRQAKSELIELSEMSDAVLAILKNPRGRLQGTAPAILSQLSQVLNGVSAASAEEQYLYPSSYQLMKQIVEQVRQGSRGSDAIREKVVELKNRIRQFEQGLSAVKPTIGENEWK